MTTYSSSKAQTELIALFISDLHLRPNLPITTQRFLDFLTHRAPEAKQLYILGDLFEYWIGDDVLTVDAYYQPVVNALRQLSDAGTEIFWMAGNRDFLVGEAFIKATGVHPLNDGDCVEIAGQRIVLLHGDAQCTDDLAYMAFRQQVRNPEWQQQFLQMPLVKRKAIVEGLRENSKMEQKSKSNEIMDVNEVAILDVFKSTRAEIIIHGHTHRPDKHLYALGMRYVLPDWECDTEELRGGWLELNSDGNFVEHRFADLST